MQEKRKARRTVSLGQGAAASSLISARERTSFRTWFLLVLLATSAAGDAVNNLFARLAEVLA
jgi:hypothetical protein